MVNRSVSNPNKPGLCVGMLGKKVIGCSYDIIRNLKGSCFDVDRYNLAMIPLLNLRSHLRLIECIAPLGKLFFATSGLSNCHSLNLVSTVLLHFSLGNIATINWQYT
jgi:hypothetical protein